VVRSCTDLAVTGAPSRRIAIINIVNICIQQLIQWVDNIRMDLGEVGWGDVDWIVLAQDTNRWRALVHSVLNLRVP
jgi:hypothetical protein